MADNFVTDAGAGGNTYASDDVAGVHYPVAKLAYGALDSATLVTTSSGFPVQEVGAALTALQLIDNLVLAEDAAHVSADPGIQVLAVRDDTLNARSGAENDYEPLHTDANGGLWTHDVNGAALAVVGGGVEATALRVTVASDSTGVLSVDDNGGSITIDGTVSVSGTVTVDSELTTADVDTGAGTDTRAVVGLIGSKSGGGQLIPGDATAGLKVDLGADNDVVVVSYGTVACGELAGATSATQMPSVACSLIKFKAQYDNAGRVYIGGASVTKKDGTTDTTTGLELQAGEETGWLPVTNANLLYRICDNTGDDLTYLALS